ncbi:hypothetical protein ACOQFV_24110 [Nocardiopsis changdeensis]|nr:MULTISPECIES: hypothetical protein [Nocardiopsis]
MTDTSHPTLARVHADLSEAADLLRRGSPLSPPEPGTETME